MDLPAKTRIDLPLVVGAAIFGLGWGISGMCPGPAILNLFNYIPHTLCFMTSLIIGQLTANTVEKLLTRQ